MALVPVALATFIANLAAAGLVVLGAAGWSQGRGYWALIGLVIMVATVIARRRLSQAILPFLSSTTVKPAVADRAVRRVYLVIGLTCVVIGLVAVVAGLVFGTGWVVVAGIGASIYGAWVLVVDRMRPPRAVGT